MPLEVQKNANIKHFMSWLNRPEVRVLQTPINAP